MAERWFLKLLTTESYGNKEIGSAIAQLRRRLITIKPILEEIGQIYVDEAKYRIKTQTSPKGRVWPHNSKLTKKLKEDGIRKSLGWKTFVRPSGRTYRRYMGHQVLRPPAIEGPNKRLVWTGTLRDKLKYRVSGNTVIVLSEVPYATTMQYGAERGSFSSGGLTNDFGESPWGDIPARPFLGTNNRVNEKVMGVLGNYLLGNALAKKIGFKQ